MTTLSCEIEGVSIVLVGNFNPKIFQPAWFSHHDLIRKQEAETADNVVVLDRITNFNTEWLSLQVTTERFEAATSNGGSFEALRDFVLGTFRILEHTPLARLGINRDMHYRVLPVESYIEFGHYIVPKTPWTPIMTNPVTRSLTVEGLVRRGTMDVKLTVRVEPSVRIQPGVYIGTNEDYEATGETDNQALMGALEIYWDTAQTSAKAAAEQLLKWHP